MASELNVGGLTVDHTSKAVSYTPSDAAIRVKGTSTGYLLFGTDASSPHGAWINTDVEAQPLILMGAGGNVGIGVSAPDAPLHIFKDLNNAATATPDESSSYQLHINGANGATGDTVGLSMSTTDGNDYISASMVAIDVGATGLADLAFSTRGSGGIAERLRISSAGTTWASADGFASAYHSGADAAFAAINAGATRPGIRLYNTDTGTASQNAISFKRNTTEVGTITTTNTATAFNTSSDYRLKENVTALTGALDRLDSIPVYNFNFKTDPTKTVDGFLAHEVSEFVPEAIHGTKDEMQTVVVTEAVEAVEAVAATLYVEGDELPDGVAIGDEKTPAVEAVDAVAEVTEEQPKYQGIDQSKLVPLLVAAVKELKAKVETLENA